jgi:23S rRNA (cytosine1962-C5)-methyltransferase
MILTTLKNNDYELIDSGVGMFGGEKLERFGKYVIRRPDPEVLWKKNKSEEVWNNADATFSTSSTGGKWNVKEETLKEWNIKIEDLEFLLKIQNFKHIGIFPEHIEQWKWMVEKVESRKSKVENGEKEREIKILNLFGYTGGASIALAKSGDDKKIQVTHVDSSEPSVDWTKENAKLNNISNIRFIVDDARKFVEREIKRGVKYDAIVMDPPVYGKGDKKQSVEKAWHIENDLLPLLARCKELLSSDPIFFVVAGYASEYSHLSYKNALSEVFPNTDLESGELAVKESESERLLPAGIFARVTF